MDTFPARLLVITPQTVARVCARSGDRGVLAEAEVEAYERLTVERRRRDWLAGRVAAKRLLRAALRDCGQRVPPYRSITVLNDAVGAPRFAILGRPDLADRWNVSIAHDEGVAAAALACTARSGRIGVDIERDRPFPAGVLQLFLTPREQESLAGHPDSFAPPLALWVLKEAVVKAAYGAGAPAMREAELARHGPTRWIARLVRDDAPPVRIRAILRTVGAHVVAIATCRQLDAA